MTEKLSADRLVIVAPKEWAEGRVRVKLLASREEFDVVLEDWLRDVTGVEGASIGTQAPMDPVNSSRDQILV